MMKNWKIWKYKFIAMKILSILKFIEAKVWLI